MIPFAAIGIAFLSLLGATGHVFKNQFNNFTQKLLHQTATQQEPTIQDFILLRQFEAIELMLHKGTPATLQHYRQLALMEKLESNAQKKAQIVVTLNLIERYLQEQGILSQQDFSKLKRPALTLTAAAASSTTSVEQSISARNINVKFLEAVQSNDVSLMEQLHAQGANPSCCINCLQPLEIAIAQGHIEATQWLLTKPIAVTTDHRDSSQRFILIVESNFQEKFNKDQEVIDETERQKSILRHAIRIKKITPEVYEARKRIIEENARLQICANRLDLTFTTDERSTDSYDQKMAKQKAAYHEELSKRVQITTMLQEHISRSNRK